jgi:hypothetical protein
MAIAAVAIAGFASIAGFGWALYRERGLRASSDIDAMGNAHSERQATAELNDALAKLEALMARRFNEETEKNNATKVKIAAAASDGAAIAAVGDSVWASAPSSPATHINPLNADPVPVAADAGTATARGRR